MSIKQKVVKSVHMDELDMRDKMDTRPTPSEELEPVQLGDEPDHPPTSGPSWLKTSKIALLDF